MTSAPGYDFLVGGAASAGAAASAPGLTDEGLADDRSLGGWLREACGAFFHAVGTSRMGARNDARRSSIPNAGSWGWRVSWCATRP